jgi:hypothetical protein
LVAGVPKAGEVRDQPALPYQDARFLSGRLDSVRMGLILKKEQKEAGEGLSLIDQQAQRASNNNFSLS